MEHMNTDGGGGGGVNWLDFRHCRVIYRSSQGFPFFGNAFDFPEGYAFFVSGHGWT